MIGEKATEMIAVDHRLKLAEAELTSEINFELTRTPDNLPARANFPPDSTVQTRP
jgi:hypothetical protein